MNIESTSFIKSNRKEGVFIYTKRYSDFGKMMAEYEAQLRKTYEESKTLEEETEPEPVSEAPAENISFEETVEPPNEQQEAPAENNDSGNIVVTASSGRGAYPLAGVRIIVDRFDEEDDSARQEVIGILLTDRSGRTPSLAVKTVSRRLSQSPGSSGPFVTYYVSARVAGYYPINSLPVDVFGGQTSILELDFVPEPIEYEGSERLW